MSHFEHVQVWRISGNSPSHYDFVAITETELIYGRMHPDIAKPYFKAAEVAFGDPHEMLHEIIWQKKCKKTLRFARPNITGFGSIAAARALCVETAEGNHHFGDFDDKSTIPAIAGGTAHALFGEPQQHTAQLNAFTPGLRKRSLELFGYSMFVTVGLGYAGLSGDHSDVYVRRGKWLLDLIDQIPDALALGGAALSLSLGIGFTVHRLQSGYDMQMWRPASSPAHVAVEQTEPVTTF